MHDLVVAGGRVLDPANGVDATLDVAVDGGRIAAVGPDLEGRERLDARGLLVVPGLIDLHVHVYDGVSHYGVDADEHLLRRGTTTGVDAGSAGAQTFPAFRRWVLDRVETRVVAYVHVAVEGMISARVGELEDLRWASPEDCAATIEANRDVAVGVKLRAGWQMVGQDPRPAIALARRAADLVELPLMVHVIDMQLPLPELLAVLRGGDVVTHCLHGSDGGGVLDAAGRVLPEVRDAAERGVVLDVGHGIGSFAWRVARPALEQGLLPSTISSDIHAHNRNGPVYDLPRTMSKLLHLGLPLADVVRMATAAPAASIAHVAPGLGTLGVGAPADVSVLALEDGSWPLTDGEGVTEHAAQRLAARHVVRAGRVVACDPPG